LIDSSKTKHKVLTDCSSTFDTGISNSSIKD